jgi:hypothetical protein
MFTRAESVKLLRRRVPELSAADATRIAAAANDLPLAVAQAGAYLATTGSSAAGYLDHLATLTASTGPADRRGARGHPPLPPGARPDDGAGLAATTSAALRELGHTDPAALDLLHHHTTSLRLRRQANPTPIFWSSEPFCTRSWRAGGGRIYRDDLLMIRVNILSRRCQDASKLRSTLT